MAKGDKCSNTGMYIAICVAVLIIIGISTGLGIPLGLQVDKYNKCTKGEITLNKGTNPKVANSKTTVCPLDPAGAKCTVITCKKDKDNKDVCDSPVEQFGNIGKISNTCPKCMRLRKHKTIRYNQHKFLLK